MIPAAPIPAKKRNSVKVSRSLAKADPRDPQTRIPVAIETTRIRPNRSPSGPYRIWNNPYESVKVATMCPAVAVEIVNSLATLGSMESKTRRFAPERNAVHARAKKWKFSGASSLCCGICSFYLNWSISNPRLGVCGGF